MKQRKKVKAMSKILTILVISFFGIVPYLASAAAVDSTRYQSLDSILDQIFTRKKQEFVWRLNNEVPGSKKLFFTIDLDEEILVYIKGARLPWMALLKWAISIGACIRNLTNLKILFFNLKESILIILIFLFLKY